MIKILSSNNMLRWALFIALIAMGSTGCSYTQFTVENMKPSGITVYSDKIPARLDNISVSPETMDAILKRYNDEGRSYDLNDNQVYSLKVRYGENNFYPTWEEALKATIDDAGVFDNSAQPVIMIDVTVHDVRHPRIGIISDIQIEADYVLKEKESEKIVYSATIKSTAEMGKVLYGFQAIADLYSKSVEGNIESFLTKLRRDVPVVASGLAGH